MPDKVRITQEVADAFGFGRCTFEDVQKMRAMLGTLGIEVELHEVEREKAAQLRAAAENQLARADAIDEGAGARP